MQDLPRSKFKQLAAVFLMWLLPATQGFAATQTCKFDSPARVKLDSAGWLTATVRTQGSTSSFGNVRLCSVLSSPGEAFSSALCSYAYSTLLAAAIADSRIWLSLDTDVMNADGLWGGSCNSLAANANLAPALLSVIIEPG